MRYELYRNEIHVSQSLEKAIVNKVEKIRKRLKRYHPDTADLEVRLGHLENANEYECNLKLVAFKETLHTRKNAPELRVAVDKSFDAMMKELDHYRIKINKSLQPGVEP
jgi:ribosome-associated translation inhibitor RaiA